MQLLPRQRTIPVVTSFGSDSYQPSLLAGVQNTYTHRKPYRLGPLVAAVHAIPQSLVFCLH